MQRHLQLRLEKHLPDSYYTVGPDRWFTTTGEEKGQTSRSEILIKIVELHSRVTTNTKEIMTAASAKHQQQNKEIQRMRDELISRVGVLEKWRHVLIGGSIVVGFMLHKFIDFGS